MNNQIQELIVSPKKVLFIFDFDGTMLEAKYGDNTILGCPNNDEEVLKRDLEKCVYDDVKPLRKVQEMVKEIYGNNKSVKVLSRIHNGIEVLNKMKYLYKTYPQIKIEDFIGVIEYNHKEVVLEHFSKIYDEVVYIDDNLEVLIQMENNLLEINNIRYFHVSSIFLD